jgi:pimeloyl-ACP methyl ester carboxylesterase
LGYLADKIIVRNFLWDWCHGNLEVYDAYRLTPKKNTSIIYFHGVGTPRRYEETSRLADAFDQFAQSQEIGSVGRLRQIEVKWEASRVGDKNDVAFISATRVVHRFRKRKGFRKIGIFHREGSYRIYEGYWSPATAGGFAATLVLFWLFSNLINPFVVLIRSWRTHTRLKLTALHRMLTKLPQSEQLEEILEVLESHYRSFESWPARRKFPRGTFSDFIEFATSHGRDKRSIKKDILRIAQKWRRAFLVEQMMLALASITFLVATFETLIVILLLACSVFTFLIPEPALYASVTRFAIAFPFPQFTLPAIILVTGVFLWRARFYLSYVVADVMFWATTVEKDWRFARKREIVDSAEGLPEHVVFDPNCDRVIVIGHSLGSAIAFQGLIALGRKLLAPQGTAPIDHSNLLKIKHLITVGSPIDRIHYFFELYESEYHRFNRIMDDVQGSTSDAPFSLKPAGGADWTNIWDDTDPIISPLFSPVRRSRDRTKITNLLTRSSFRPNPIAAHSNYFLSQAALQTIFWISIFGRAPKTKPNSIPLWAKLLLQTSPRICLWLVAAFVWMALFSLADVLSGWLLLIPSGLLVVLWIITGLCDSV